MHEPPPGSTFGEIAETDLLPSAAPRRSDARRLWAFAVAGAVLGALPAADGLYSLHVWAFAGVVAVVGLVAAVVTLDRRPPWATVAAPLLLGLLGGLQLLSQAWAESSAQASLEGHRTLVYAAALGLLVLVASDTRRRLWLLGAAAAGGGLWRGGGVAAGATLVGLVTAVRLAGPHGPDLFLRSRLFEPLGY